MKKYIIRFPDIINNVSLLSVTNDLYAQEFDQIHEQFKDLQTKLSLKEEVAMRYNNILVINADNSFNGLCYIAEGIDVVDITDTYGISLIEQTKELIIERLAINNLFISAQETFQPNTVGKILGVGHYDHFRNTPLEKERMVEKRYVHQFMLTNRKAIELFKKTKARQLIKCINNGFTFYTTGYIGEFEGHMTYNSIFNK